MPDASKQNVSVKRYAEGKFYLFADLLEGQEKTIERALKHSSNVDVIFDREVFRKELRNAGIAEAEIERCLSSIRVLNEAFAADRA